jgi:hypothetical protein
MSIGGGGGSDKGGRRVAECVFCHEHDREDWMEYAPCQERWCHRRCIQAAIAHDPFVEPTLSMARELHMTAGCGQRQAILCRNGHEMRGKNVVLVKKGGRIYQRCVPCYEAQQRRQRAGVVRRDYEKRRCEAKKARAWRKSECRNGHAYTEETVIVGRYGERRCRLCLKMAGQMAREGRWGKQAGTGGHQD